MHAHPTNPVLGIPTSQRAWCACSMDSCSSMLPVVGSLGGAGQSGGASQQEQQQQQCPYCVLWQQQQVAQLQQQVAQQTVELQATRMQLNAFLSVGATPQVGMSTSTGMAASDYLVPVGSSSIDMRGMSGMGMAGCGCAGGPGSSPAMPIPDQKASSAGFFNAPAEHNPFHKTS